MRIVGWEESGEPGHVAVWPPLGGTGFAGYGDVAAGGGAAGAAAVVDDRTHAFVHRLNVFLADVQIIALRGRKGFDDFVVQILNLADQPGLWSELAIGDGGHGAGHLQRGGGEGSLTDGHVRQIPGEDFAAVGDHHPVVAGDVTNGFAADGQSGAFAVPEPGGHAGQAVCTSGHAGAGEPRVA